MYAATRKGGFLFVQIVVLRAVIHADECTHEIEILLHQHRASNFHLCILLKKRF